MKKIYKVVFLLSRYRGKKIFETMSEHPTLSYVAIVLLCSLIIISTVFYVINKSEEQNKQQKKLLTNYLESTGLIGNNEVIIGNSCESFSFNGSVFLFSGSINGGTEQVLKIGFTDKNGVSSILFIPIRKIKFYIREDQSPLAKFVIDTNIIVEVSNIYTPAVYIWKERMLQDNIDDCLTELQLTITPTQYQTLLAK